MKLKLLYVCLLVIVINPLTVSALTNEAVEKPETNINTTLNVIVSGNISSWSKIDSKYVNHLKNTTSASSLIATLINECGILEKASDELNKTAYVTKSNTIVYHPITSVKISLVRNGVYQRQKLLNLINKGETSKFTYDTEQLVDITDVTKYHIYEDLGYSTEYMTEYFNNVITVLESKILPSTAISGVKIYLLPYILSERKQVSDTYCDNRVGGYTSSIFIKGREEIIVCSMYKITYLIHEIGHVYFDEVLGTSFTPNLSFLNHDAELWGKYVSIYPEVKFALENKKQNWSNSTYENSSEDFKCYFSYKLANIKGLNSELNKQLMYAYKYTKSEYKESDFANFINSIPENFNSNTSFPGISMSLYNMSTVNIYAINNGYERITTDRKVRIELSDNDKVIMKVAYIIVINPDSEKQTFNFADSGLGEDVLKSLPDEKRKEMVKEYLPKVCDIDIEKSGTYKIDFVIQAPTGELCVINTQVITKI